MRVVLRPTVKGDFAQVISLPVPWRVRAVTAVLDGRVVGIGGLGYRDDAVVGFAIITDELRKYPRALHRAGLRGMAIVRASGVLAVCAEAEPGNPAAERWLLRLGFRREGEAFVWRRPRAPAKSDA